MQIKFQKKTNTLPNTQITLSYMLIIIMLWMIEEIVYQSCSLMRNIAILSKWKLGFAYENYHELSVKIKMY